VAAVEEDPGVAVPPREDFGRVFVLTLSGTYDDIESLREPLTAFLKDERMTLNWRAAFIGNY